MNPLYLGLTEQAVRDSARDVLAERCLAEGEPSLRSVRGLLPQLEEGAYGFFSGVQTQGATLFDGMGRLYDQEQHAFSPGRLLGDAAPFFDPADLDEQLGTVAPAFGWVPHAPILRWMHADGSESLTVEAFVRPLDPGVHPHTYLLAIRRRGKDLLWEKALLFCPSGIEDVWPETRQDIDRAVYNQARADTVAWWAEHQPRVSFEGAEPELLDVFDRVWIQGRCSFSGLHPKYGHAFYGVSLGDNFPPNLICAMEDAFLTGDLERAWGLARYLLANCVQADGALAYYGPSAAEYGQLLWILARMQPALEALGGYRGLARPIRRMAKHLLSLRDGDGLIVSGAEADTRGRVAVYANNNLWAVRGLQAADALLRRLGKPDDHWNREAEALLAIVLRALADETVASSFGPLPPFRLGYPALPWTLSRCRETNVPVDALTLTDYLREIWPVDAIADGQNLSENIYANYRYYPEMLSSALLPSGMADAVAGLRRNGGGELLGMTRFADWLDDWPAFHMARYLLESGQRGRFLLLLYAHTLHHGRPDWGVYYEQAGIDGRVRAEDCVPSLLLPSLMLCWAYAFEPVSENALRLGLGVAAHWYSANAVGVDGIQTRWGQLAWRAVVQDKTLTLQYDLPPMDAPVYWHCPLQGARAAEGTPRVAEGVFRLPACTEARVKGSLEFVLDSMLAMP